jgi:apolipoprotein N-acyltransferase
MYSYYPIISGLLLALAFPKFDLWWLAWVALVPFFLTLNRAEKPRAALLAGFFFGLAFFGVTLFWMTSLFRFVGLFAYLAWVSLAIFQSLFVVLFAYLYFKISQLQFVLKFEIGGLSFLQALLWVLVVELLRAFGPFGVPVGAVGYSQAQLLPLIQIASFSQVYGVSFLVVFFNAALAEVLRKPATKRRGFLSFGLAILLIIAALAYGYSSLVHRPSSIGHRFALIQPNIDQFDRMNQSLVQRNLELQAGLTRQAAKAGAQVIVWPETALYAYILRDPAIFQQLKHLARETNAWLVVGTPHYDYDARIYNAIVAISPSGEVTSRYDKERLVPFGEYLPFRPLLLPLLGRTGYFSQDFASNSMPEALSIAGQQVAAGVCFESTFPDAIKARVKNDSAYILIVTNDAWFADSAAPYIHFNCGVFRAIENRKWLVQCGNSGISAFIDPYGRVVGQTKVNQQTVLDYQSIRNQSEKSR